MDAHALEACLAHFTGSEELHAHWTRTISYTDGVKFLAESAGAYWLIDLIASHQKRCRKDPRLRDFQIWELRVTGQTAYAVCLADSDDEAFQQYIPFTDFPLPSIKFYLENDVLMLPGER